MRSESNKAAPQMIDGQERMQKQMDVMTRMMMHLLEGKSKEDDNMEQVKPGVTYLPMLQEPGDTAPIDFVDWLTMIEPAMTDLSDGSHFWWMKVMQECEMWYSQAEAIAEGDVFHPAFGGAEGAEVDQPGGTQEKTVILRQLEDPGEQPTPGAAAGALRKWTQWL